ncbi:hypothetical protein HMPREF9098_0230 [Kingella denitrificans ATCC 33394]|uniref:Uncharacterized protein n=1 Tax=Kingella denitrificans ATCC 33394 TaxID=888741 RepID=F0EWJ4_9NEIS|nr:hypothetical protein HMPREF9098_0230 [Kingella denitrificans ATCC 33394]
MNYLQTKQPAPINTCRLLCRFRITAGDSNHCPVQKQPALSILYKGAGCFCHQPPICVNHLQHLHACAFSAVPNPLQCPCPTTRRTA